MARNLEFSSNLICKIRPVEKNNISNLTHVHVNEESRFFLVCGSGKNVDVFNSDHQKRLEFPSVVSGVLVAQGDNDVIKLWVTTEEGTVYLIPDLERSIWRESEDRGNESGDDIFDDLVDSKNSQAKTGANHQVDVQGYAVLKLPNAVVGFQIIREIGVILCKIDDSGYLLTWYDLSKLESHTNKAERLQNYKELGEIFFPTISKESIVVAPCSHSPVLEFILTTENPIEDATLQAKCINKYLYNSLFGINNNLLDADILLFGLPNGHVYGASLKTAGEEHRLIYDLEEPVVGIHLLQFDEELTELEEIIGPNSSKKVNNCILFVGGNGKVVCIFCGENKKELSYKEVFVSSRVVCSHFVQSTLLLATETELLMVGGKDVQKLNQYQYLDCLGLSLYNVRAICTSTADYGTNLYVLSKRGQVLHKQINFENLESLSVNKSRGRLSLKDLLTNIGHVSERLKESQKEVSSVNSILEQLAIASSMVLSSYSSTSGAPKDLYPVVAQISVSHVDFGSNIKFLLVTRLVNTGIVALSEDWIVILTINSRQEDGAGNSTETTSHTVGAYSKVITQRCYRSLWKQNGFQEIHHELPPDIIHQLPLVVTLSFSYTLPSTVSCMKGKSLTVSIHNHNVDILHFVKPASTHSSFGQISELASSTQRIRESLYQLALQRPTGWKARKILESSRKESGIQYSASVNVTQSTARNITSKGVVSEIRLLQTLLPSLPDLKLPMVRLVTPDGHQVVLSVSKSGEANGYDILLQCPTPFLLCQLRSAVLQRAQSFVTQTGAKCTTRDVRNILQQIKNVQREIQSLQNAMSDKSAPVDQITSQTVQLWIKLRSIKYPT